MFIFRVWSAGDAKYLIVLSLFIPHISNAILVWNIALVIAAFLISSYIFFYLKKFSHHIHKDSRLQQTVKEDLKNKCKNYLQNKSPEKILISLVLFFITFVSLRFYRIYAVNFFIEHNYTSYFSLTIWIGIVLIIVWSIFLLYKKYISKNIFLRKISFFLFLWIFIIFCSYEYIYNTKDFLSLSYKIITLYFAIYLIIKIIKYTVDIYAGHDYYVKSISKLEEDDIIERSDFNKKILPLLQDKKKILHQYNIPLYGNIVVDTEIKENLISLIRSLNHHNKKRYHGNSVIQDVKCMKTFAFAPFLFTACMITLIFENIFLDFLYNFIYSLFV